MWHTTFSAECGSGPNPWRVPNNPISCTEYVYHNPCSYSWLHQCTPRLKLTWQLLSAPACPNNNRNNKHPAWTLHNVIYLVDKFNCVVSEWCLDELNTGTLGLYYVLHTDNWKLLILFHWVHDVYFSLRTGSIFPGINKTQTCNLHCHFILFYPRTSKQPQSFVLYTSQESWAEH